MSDGRVLVGSDKSGSEIFVRCTYAMASSVSSSSEYSSSTWTPVTPIVSMSSVNTPGSDSMVVHSMTRVRGNEVLGRVFGKRRLEDSRFQRKPKLTLSTRLLSSRERAHVVARATCDRLGVMARKRSSHGKEKHLCKECNPCPHGKVEYHCAQCTPCPHWKVKNNCADCNLCPHWKHKSKCVDCNACPHGKRKVNCTDCSRCPHGKLKRNCAACDPCPHFRVKSRCAECNPCPHGGKVKSKCGECNPCPHGRLKDHWGGGNMTARSATRALTAR